MKVIVSGKDNRRVECEKCRCIFEYDEEDVQQHDVRDTIFGLFIDSKKDSVIEYVECPECGELAVLHRQNKRKEISEDDYSIRAYKDKA